MPLLEEGKSSVSFTALVLFGITLVGVTYYVIMYGILPSPGAEDMLTELTPLKAVKKVVDPDDVQKKLLGTSGCTVMGFFKLMNGDRTMKYTDQYTPLMEIPNNWSLDVSPSPSENKPSGARLRIQVKDEKGIQNEYVELPSIPKQKWVMIAVLRDGRRFDVIYDKQIVASHRLKNYPVIISAPLNVGNNGLDGKAIHVCIHSRRLLPSEVEKERMKYVDTNNIVVEDDDIHLSFPTIKLFPECPSGFPCEPVTKPPSNNLHYWDSPYA